MVIKRIGVLKLGIFQGCAFALLGLVFGLLFTLFASMFGGIFGAAGHSPAAGIGMGMIGGIASMIFLPIIYGVFGFIVGVISAFVYNLVASIVGGIEIDVE